MGVYRIRNRENGRAYVAASRDLRARLNRHRMELKTGGERVRALLEDWRTFGEDAFEFEVLDRLEPLDRPDYDPADDLAELEAIWLAELRPFLPDGYNPSPKGARDG
jgi:hypothetical protein